MYKNFFQTVIYIDNKYEQNFSTANEINFSIEINKNLSLSKNKIHSVLQNITEMNYNNHIDISQPFNISIDYNSKFGKFLLEDCKFLLKPIKKHTVVTKEINTYIELYYISQNKYDISSHAHINK